MEQLIAEVSERPMPHLLAEAINVGASIQRGPRAGSESSSPSGACEPEIVFTDLNTQELRESPKVVNLVLFALSRPWP